MHPALLALLIALDPGHSPQSPGAFSARAREEYRFNEDMVGVLAKSFAAAPKVRVARTRRNGEEATLYQRSARAKAAGANLLLSIHHDSPHPDDFESWQDGDVVRTHSTAGRGFSIHVRGDRADSVRIAKAIGRSLVDAGFTPSHYHVFAFPVIDEELGIYDRRYLGLLNSARLPAVLVECGFISHLEEETELRDSERQQRMAKAIVEGALKGLGRKE